MTKLKLTPLEDEKPVKLTITLPAALHRNLIAYAKILAGEGKAVEPGKLVVPMLERFIASDRAFRKAHGADRRPNSRQSTSDNLR
jgi:hypothetical protein